MSVPFCPLSRHAELAGSTFQTMLPDPAHVHHYGQTRRQGSSSCNLAGQAKYLHRMPPSTAGSTITASETPNPNSRLAYPVYTYTH